MDAAGRFTGSADEVMSPGDKAATRLHDLTVVQYRGVVEGPPLPDGSRNFVAGGESKAFLKAKDNDGKVYLIEVPHVLALDVAIYLMGRRALQEAVCRELGDSADVGIIKGPSKERIERLARVLEYHPALDERLWPNASRITGWKTDVISQALGPFGPKGIPWEGLLEAIGEFESGHLFGDQYRCCVCGNDANGNSQFVPASVWCCGCCAWDFLHKAEDELKLNSGDREADAARVVIRARKLYQEKKLHQERNG